MLATFFTASVAATAAAAAVVGDTLPCSSLCAGAAVLCSPLDGATVLDSECSLASAAGALVVEPVIALLITFLFLWFKMFFNGPLTIMMCASFSLVSFFPSGFAMFAVVLVVTTNGSASLPPPEAVAVAEAAPSGTLSSPTTVSPSDEGPSTVLVLLSVVVVVFVVVPLCCPSDEETGNTVVLPSEDLLYLSPWAWLS